jgi:hypothetical protein
MDNMPNFKLQLEIENEKSNISLHFQQNDNEKDEQDDANYEQWPQGEESLPIVTFQPNWT